jgi:hypothetical protein
MALLTHHFLHGFDGVAEKIGRRLDFSRRIAKIQAGLADGVLCAPRAQPSEANQVADRFDWCAAARARSAAQLVSARDVHFGTANFQPCRTVASGRELGFFEHELAIIGVFCGQQHGVPCGTNASTAIHVFP